MLKTEKGFIGIKAKWLLYIFYLSLSYPTFANENKKLESEKTKDIIEKKESTINTREFVYQSVVEFANWVDDFFGESEQLEDANFDYLRLRNDFTFKGGETPRYRPKIKAKVRLPKLNKKISLIFSNEKNDESNEIDDGAELKTISNDNNTSAALNYESELYNRSKFDSRIGLGSGLKLFAFTRHSFQAYKSETLTIRNYNYIIWKEEDGLGFATKINLAKVISHNRLFRWDYGFLRAEKTRGNEWSTGIAIVDQLGDEKWIAYQLGANGESELDWDVTEYKLSTRYRMKTDIDWLYFEVEPAIAYVKTIENPERHYVLSIKLRFEIKLER